MNELSKLQLSAEEKAMVLDSHWLLTKNSILKKGFVLFGNTADTYRALFENAKPAPELLVQSPKISKGENYGGPPYLMLDYPRLFGREDCFAIRTMFWWGNFLSFTWQIKGVYFVQYREAIISCHQELSDAGFQVCINEDEWRHDFEADNYMPLNLLSKEKLATILKARSFSKLAVMIPLERWNDSPEILTNLFRSILRVGRISSPGDGKDL